MSSRVRLQEVSKLDVEPAAPAPSMFEILMGSINPFAQYIIREVKAQEQAEKHWQLEPSIFRKPDNEVNRQNLIRTSSEMFVIYKFTNDPQMKVKSVRYTQDKFVPVKDLFPEEESTLFETSILQQLKLQELQKAQSSQMMAAF